MARLSATAGISALGVAGFSIALYLAANHYLSPEPSALLSCVSEGERGATMSQSCARETIAAVLRRSSASDVLAYVTDLKTPVSVVKNCHGIAHAVGENLYARSGSVESSLSQCTSACFGGCLHGVVETAIEEKTGNREAGEDIAHAGDLLFSEGEKYCSDPELCHGIGHIVYKNYEAYPRSLEACSSIAEGMNAERCYEGVFMESLGDESSFGFPQSPAVPPQNEARSYGYPCAAQEPGHRLACFRYLPVFQDALFYENKVTDSLVKAEIQMQNCRTFTGVERTGCVFGMASYLTTRVFDRDYTATEQYCTSLTNIRERDACLMGVISNWISGGLKSRALGTCSAISDRPFARLCYFTVFEVISRTEPVAQACEGDFARARCDEYLRDYGAHAKEAQQMQRDLLGTPI